MDIIKIDSKWVKTCSEGCCDDQELTIYFEGGGIYVTLAGLVYHTSLQVQIDKFYEGERLGIGYKPDDAEMIQERRELRTHRKNESDRKYHMKDRRYFMRRPKYENHSKGHVRNRERITDHLDQE